MPNLPNCLLSPTLVIPIIIADTTNGITTICINLINTCPIKVRSVETSGYSCPCKNMPTKIPKMIPEKICQFLLIPRPNAISICMCNFI